MKWLVGMIVICAVMIALLIGIRPAGQDHPLKQVILSTPDAPQVTADAAPHTTPESPVAQRKPIAVAHKHTPEKLVFEEPAIANVKIADVVIATLPESRFRQELQKLTPLARRRAASTLQRIQPSQFELDELHAQSDGAIYYECHFDGAAAQLSMAAAVDTPGTGAAAVSVANPPVYHSNSGSSNVLFLDFNGGEVTGTAWNSDSYPTYYCRPYDRDGDETTFSDSEQSEIREIFARVAEDYAPFDVDVTTEEPVSFTRTTGHAMITPETDSLGVDLPHRFSGGIAYVDVFGDNNYVTTYSPAWVKVSGVKATAEAASHELGHNLGLGHDGDDRHGYYTGHGTGDEGWAPIMGAGYYKNIVQWSKGEYPNANNSQDDLAILASELSYFTDDHGNTADGSATVLNTGSNPAATGVIEQGDDVDVFQITTGQVIDVTVTVDPDGPNLNPQVEILDSSGTILVSDAPLGDLTANVLHLPVAPDTFYIRVDGVGALDLTSGFSDYASLGNYSITLMLSDDAAMETSVASTTITEGTTSSVVGVRFTDPLSRNLSVSVSLRGDSDLSLTTSSSLPFTTSNWNSYQYVTVRAAEDDDGYDGDATLTFRSAVSDDRTVALTEGDNDYAITMSASTGGTVTSSFGFSPGGGAVAITATPAAGYSFSGWTVTGSNATIDDLTAPDTTLTATGDDAVTATFTVIPDDDDDGGCGGCRTSDGNPSAIGMILLLGLVLACRNALHGKRQSSVNHVAWFDDVV
ncbi:hypothetical protein BVY04_02545 [bacterium M21]|nr:hypothetical protein BVY04_02545 [bacterium M21]